jgi:hypothetical protein
VETPLKAYVRLLSQFQEKMTTNKLVMDAIVNSFFYINEPPIDAHK